ncbi:hypothetical protein BOTBODRAFT_33432 [Botryobasidium botryosum FD-172 SS1]|uniref:Protein sym1 n=1 Tax=Botryobasidium botryosum (strain FD-172 SS1) TaxID=930990 RepID=A0A067MD94_BOTB1|nr:hypothetical protein BOTBODRAFT_33432 [Botryobasidium botryosum FD-172 SS1]
MSSVALARIYQAQFNARPTTTLAVTNGSLSALADIIAQSAQLFNARKHHSHHHKIDPPPLDHYDVHRTLRFAAFGVAMGPLIGRWNKFLEHAFPLRPARVGARYGASSKVSLRALGKRVLGDQLIMAPIGLGLFVGSMGLMEGRNAAGVRQKYADMYLPAIVANWKVWPVAQLINFRFMPLPYRVPFQATCGVFWTLYLSLLNAREDERLDGDRHN